MKYALQPLVSVWMSLYYNLQRIKKWSKERGILPNIHDVFTFLTFESYRKEDRLSARNARYIYSMIQRLRFDKTLRVLDHSLQNALATEDIQFEAGKDVISLVDFPRFCGASWAHNDLIVFVPSLNTAAVVKLSDKRFIPIHETLSSITMGLDPFIGTAFKLSEVKLNPVFNRIRCSSHTEIDVASFHQFKSFQELIETCKASLKTPTYMASAILGSIPLNLSRCIVARYENYYSLMEFFRCKARIRSVKRNKDWSYDFAFDFEGVPCKGSMLRDSLFDISAEPEKIPSNSKVELLGFVTYGRTSLQAFGTRIQVLALQATNSVNTDADNIQEDENYLPTVNEIENELIQLELRKERKIYGKRKHFKVPEIKQPMEEMFVRITDSLIVGDIAKLLSAQNVTIHELFEWDNGGKPLLLMWSRGGRRSSNAVEELRSALKFIMGTRYEVKIPSRFIDYKGAESNNGYARH
jgi:hypothetical protein